MAWTSEVSLTMSANATTGIHPNATLPVLNSVTTATHPVSSALRMFQQAGGLTGHLQKEDAKTGKPSPIGFLARRLIIGTSLATSYVLLTNIRTCRCATAKSSDNTGGYGSLPVWLLVADGGRQRCVRWRMVGFGDRRKWRIPSKFIIYVSPDHPTYIL